MGQADVMELLRARDGVALSVRQIADLLGQSQSCVCEVVTRLRKQKAVDVVLERNDYGLLIRHFRLARDYYDED